MNQKGIDWQFFFAKFLKEKSVNRRHYESNITLELFFSSKVLVSDLKSLVLITS